MKIKVTKKAEFEVRFFARLMPEKEDWGFALPTICFGSHYGIFTIAVFFAFWCAGVDIRKAEPKLND